MATRASFALLPATLNIYALALSVPSCLSFAKFSTPFGAFFGLYPLGPWGPIFHNVVWKILTNLTIESCLRNTPPP
jgi:hypothetical protein